MSIFTANIERLSKVSDLEEQTRKVREKGGLFHQTNPKDAWMCDCGVFGKGGSVCWACGSTEIEFHVTPRFGGGAHTCQWED